MNYFDRYIMIHSDSFDDERSRTHEYQIVAVAALFLAIKIHATSCEVENIQEVRAQALSKILYGTVKQQDIFVMEMNMLIAFEWHVYPPTMHQFAFLFFQLHPLGPTSTTVSYLYEATRYQVELAVFVPALMLGFKPSVVVVAAMKNAEERIETDCPGILTNEMKQSFERMLMEDPSIIIDPNAVAQCQLLFKRVCPQLPDLGYFGNDPDQVSAPGYNVHEDQVVAHGYNIQENTAPITVFSLK